MQGLIRAIVVAKSCAVFGYAARILHFCHVDYALTARVFHFTAQLLHLPRGFCACRADFVLTVRLLHFAARLRVTLLGHHIIAL